MIRYSRFNIVQDICCFKIQRIQLFGILFFLIISMSSTGWAFEMAPPNPEFVKYQEDIQRGRYQSTVTSKGYSLGYIPSPIDLSHADRTRQPSCQLDSSLPSYYDLRTTGKLTVIRNQGNCGACWAFATFGSLESFLMPYTWDFSEQNLNDEHGFAIAPCQGGNPLMSVAYLARWSGPVNESDDPYQFSSVPVQKHVQKMTYIPRTQFTYPEIKQAVMNHGAVTMAMLWNDTYYNGSTHSYFCWSNSGDGHAVAIVGWDDNFSRYNFNQAPPENGAFIVRNSWGPDFGDGGYFYMSYYDMFAGNDCWAFHNAESTDNYLSNYQYDTLGWSGSLGYNGPSAWGANIFQASSTASLTAVSFYAVSSAVTYEIQIYTGVTNGNPASGKTGIIQTGTLSEIGYHTIVLSYPVSVTAGQQFSVAVQFNTPGFNYPIPVESNAVCNTGESYVSVDGKTWVEVSNTNSKMNVCIKAFTSTSSSSSYPGDLDHDGDVDTADFSIFHQNYGATDCGNPADLDGDCVVGVSDFSIFHYYYGSGV